MNQPKMYYKIKDKEKFKNRKKNLSREIIMERITKCVHTADTIEGVFSAIENQLNAIEEEMGIGDVDVSEVTQWLDRDKKE